MVTDWTVPCLISCRANRFFSSPNRPYRLWGKLTLLFNLFRGSFSGLKRSERDAENSPPSGGEGKKISRVISLFVLYTFMAGTGKNLSFFGVFFVLSITFHKIQKNKSEGQ
jgi:hypothetical protein